MKPEKQKLYDALKQELTECTEVKIKAVMNANNIARMKTNDIREVCDKLLKTFPDYRIVYMPDTKIPHCSLYEHGTLTCCEYDDGKEYQG